MLFKNVREAIEWAVRFGAYRNYAAARSAYFALRQKVNPQTAEDMQEPWWQHVNDMANAMNLPRTDDEKQLDAWAVGEMLPDSYL